MNRIRSRWTAALAAALGLLVTACGGDGASTSSGSANGKDRAFAAAMIPHHRSAVDMAKIAQTKGEHPETKKLAATIVSAQDAEIAQMQMAVERFKAAGVKQEALGVPEHAMGMNGDASTLETAQPFDREFVDMMIPHHRGAIRMARAELKQGNDPEMRKLAQAVIDAQTREIDQMNMWRVDWYGRASPAGGVPAEDDTGMHDGM
jgi:uncharacterized protein (DUF305 family)